MNAVCAPTSAMAVANWFIERAKQEPEVPTLDQMKLYKVVYFAHAWYLGNRHAPLFDEDIEAWPHGPVVRDLYIKFKDAGYNAVTKLGTEFKLVDGQINYVMPPSPDLDTASFLERIWEIYKPFTGIQLSNATHAPDEPWTLISKTADLNVKPTIPNAIIEQVYSKKVEDAKKLADRSGVRVGG